MCLRRCYLWLKGKNSESKSQLDIRRMRNAVGCYLWLKGKNSESKSQLCAKWYLFFKCCYLWLKGKNSESKSQREIPLSCQRFAVISGSKVKILKVNHNSIEKSGFFVELLSLAQR